MSDSILRKAKESAELALRFFGENAPQIDACARALGDRFREGGRLLTMGNGGSACDAEHAAVEFQHPIVEKRRAISAMALTTSSALLTAVGNDTDFSNVFADQIELLARRQDALFCLSTSGSSANVNRALKKGRQLGLLTIGCAGRDGGQMVDLCEFCFVVPSWSIHRIQEIHTMLLHLLWDQIHVTMGADDVL